MALVVITEELDDDLEVRQRAFMAHAIKLGRVAGLLIVIWLLTGGPFTGTFWPIWPIAVFGFILAKQASRLALPGRAGSSRRGHRHSCWL